MMSTNLASAEAGGLPEPAANESWWLTRWSSWLATIGAFLLAFFGLIAIPFNIISLSPISAIAGGLQVVAAAIILSIEGSSVVSILSFAKPMGAMFAGRPLFVKVAIYAALTVIPMLLNPSGLAVMLGFVCSAAITALYGMILIGRKDSLDNMVAAAQGSGDQPRY